MPPDGLYRAMQGTQSRRTDKTPAAAAEFPKKKKGSGIGD
jgi:hypothetical protein